MVEMLAVLAIVGVLSAVGISGYRYAMVKIETNNLVNELNTCSAIITTATIYHPEEDPDIDECLGGVLDKYDIEVSEIYTYEGESEKYFEFTLHHVSDEVLAELLHMDPPFITQIKVNGEVVEDGEVVSYHKPLFIKSAYAGGDNTVQIEVPVSGDADGGNGDNGSGNGENGDSGNNSDDDDNNCGKCQSSSSDGSCYRDYSKCPSRCMDGNGNPITGKVCSNGEGYYECSNGSNDGTWHACGYRNNVALLCNMSSNECECTNNCSVNGLATGRTVNQENCQCECPAEKPFWDGSECKEKECEDKSDCIGLFSDLDEECVICEDGECKSNTDTWCDGDAVRQCNKYGQASPVSVDVCLSERNQKCENGKCVCIDADLCTIGEEKCVGNQRVFCQGTYDCPRWGYQDCEEICSEGHCCKTGESWVGDQCCPSTRQCNGNCCPEGQECSNGHCCSNGETWFD